MGITHHKQIVRCNFGESWDGPPCESDPAPGCDSVLWFDASGRCLGYMGVEP